MVVFDRLGPSVEPPLVIKPYLRSRQPVLEEDLESALLRRIRRSSTSATVYRQLRCCGRIPDLVLVWHKHRRLVIVELKREIVGARAIAQLEGYVGHFAWHVEPRAEEWLVTGILAAPQIRPGVLDALPWWCAFQPLDVHLARRVA